MKTRRTAKAGSRYRVRSSVAHRELEGQILILSADDPDLWTMNESGRFIWRRLLKGAARTTIIEAFRREFGIQADDAVRDVDAFLEALEKRRIIARA